MSERTFRERVEEGVHHYADWSEADTERLIDKAVEMHEEHVSSLRDQVDYWMGKYERALIERLELADKLAEAVAALKEVCWCAEVSECPRCSHAAEALSAYLKSRKEGK